MPSPLPFPYPGRLTADPAPAVVTLPAAVVELLDADALAAFARITLWHSRGQAYGPAQLEELFGDARRALDALDAVVAVRLVRFANLAATLADLDES